MVDESDSCISQRLPGSPKHVNHGHNALEGNVSRQRRSSFMSARF